MAMAKNANVVIISIWIVFESKELNVILVHNYRQTKEDDQRLFCFYPVTVNIQSSGTRGI